MNGVGSGIRDPYDKKPILTATSISFRIYKSKGKGSFHKYVSRKSISIFSLNNPFYSEEIKLYE